MNQNFQIFIFFHDSYSLYFFYVFRTLQKVTLIWASTTLQKIIKSESNYLRLNLRKVRTAFSILKGRGNTILPRTKLRNTTY